MFVMNGFDWVEFNYSMPTCETLTKLKEMRRGGALVESMSFNRRVVGSTPALAGM